MSLNINLNSQVCLLIFDFSESLQTSYNYSDLQNLSEFENFTANDNLIALPTLKLSLKSSDGKSRKSEISVSKENISLVESGVFKLENLNDSSYIESQIISEKIFQDEYQSPKPFGYEYKSMYPMPFQKTDRSDNNYPQLTNYRSANQMKNIEELIQYMGDELFKENGDPRSTNPNRRIKFSGIYLRPRKSNTHELRNVDVYERKINHKRLKDDMKTSPTEFQKPKSNPLDPFFSFKPNQPGDINLLAERKFRFSPTFTQSRLKHHNVKQPIKYIPLHENSKCDYDCNTQDTQSSDYNPSLDVEEYDFDEQPIVKTTLNTQSVKRHSKKRPLSVMLDIYPMEDQDEQTMAFPDHLKDPPVTTSRPKIKIKPKPFFPQPYSYNMPPSPNYYHPNYGYYPNGYYYPNNRQISNRTPFKPQVVLPPELQTRFTKKKNNTTENVPTQMLVHLNLYPKRKILKTNKNDETVYEVINRRSKTDDPDFSNMNETDDELILKSNYSKDARRSIIDAILAKYNKNPEDVQIVDDNEDITIDEIRKGHAFKLPGPRIVKSSLPDGISESAIRLLSLARFRNNDHENNNEKSKRFSKRNDGKLEIDENIKINDEEENSGESEIDSVVEKSMEEVQSTVSNRTEIFDVPNVNITNVGESLAVFELNSNTSMADSKNATHTNSTTNTEEFIAVPILDFND